MHVDINGTKDSWSKNRDWALTRPALWSVHRWLSSSGYTTGKETQHPHTHYLKRRLAQAEPELL